MLSKFLQSSLHNKAVAHFCEHSNDGKKSLLKYTENYDIITLRYLIHLDRQQHCLRYVFTTGVHEPFISQIKHLNILANSFNCPALFVTPSPGTFNSSHFICGAIWNNQLLIINPLGEKQNQNSIDVLKTLSADDERTIFNRIYISTDVLQHDVGGQFSCGPICVEIIKALSTSVDLIVEHFDQWQAITHDKQIEHNGLHYAPVSIASLCLTPALFSMTPDNAKSTIEQIRSSHKHLLHNHPILALMGFDHQYIPPTYVQNQFLDECVMKAPEQVIIHRLAFEQLSLFELDSLPVYQRLQSQIISARPQPKLNLDELDFQPTEEQIAAVDLLNNVNHHDPLYWIKHHQFIVTLQAALIYVIHHYEEYSNADNTNNTPQLNSIIALSQALKQLIKYTTQYFPPDEELLQEFTQSSSCILKLMQSNRIDIIDDFDIEDETKLAANLIYQDCAQSNTTGKIPNLMHDVLTPLLGDTIELAESLVREDDHYHDDYLISVFNLSLALFETFELTEVEIRNNFFTSILQLTYAILYLIPDSECAQVLLPKVKALYSEQHHFYVNLLTIMATQKLAQDQPEESLATFQHACDLYAKCHHDDPSDQYNTLIRLSYFAGHLKQFDLAIQYTQEILNIPAEGPFSDARHLYKAKAFLAQCYRAIQQLDQSKKRLEELIESQSAICSTPEGRKLLCQIFEDYGDICILQNSTQNGLIFLEKAIKLHQHTLPFNYSKLYALHLQTGNSYSTVGDCDSSWQHLEQAIKCVEHLHPNDAQHFLFGPVFRSQANILLVKDQVLEAKIHLDKALLIYDSYPHFSKSEYITTDLVRGIFHSKTGNNEEAEKWLRHAIVKHSTLERPEDFNMTQVYTQLAKLLVQKTGHEHRKEAFKLLIEAKKSIQQFPPTHRSILLNQIMTDNSLTQLTAEFQPTADDNEEHTAIPLRLKNSNAKTPLVTTPQNEPPTNRHFSLFNSARSSLLHTINEAISLIPVSFQDNGNDYFIQLYSLQKLLTQLMEVVDQAYSYYHAQGILEEAEVKLVVLQRSQPSCELYQKILNQIRQAATQINHLIQSDVDKTHLYQRKTNSIKYQLLQLRNNSHVWQLLTTTLSSIKKLARPHNISCHIRYAWPSSDGQTQELWVQPFLNVYYDILTDAGLKMTMDIRDQHSHSVPEFSEQIGQCQNVLLIGTPSLRLKQSDPLLRIDRIKLAKEAGSKQKVFALRLIGTPEECFLSEQGAFNTHFDFGEQGILTEIKSIIDNIVYDQIDQNLYQQCWYTIQKDKQAYQFMLPITETEHLNCQQLDKQYQSEAEELAKQLTYQFVQQLQCTDALFANSQQHVMTQSQSKQDISFTGIFQLPSRLAHFTGREDQLSELAAFCHKNKMTVVRRKQGQQVSGSSGIGKTLLMVEFAHQQLLLHKLNKSNPEQGYAAVLFFHVNPDIDNIDSLANQFIQLARELGINTQQHTGPNLVTKVYETLSHRLEEQHRCLVIMDNAPNIKSIKKYLPLNSSQFTSAVTTRNNNRQEWIGFQNVALDIFSMEDAIQYINKMLIIEHTDDDAKSLAVDKGRRYPLALTAAIAFMNTTTTSIPDYIELLTIQEGLYIEEFPSDDPYQRSIFATLRLNLSAICTDQSQSSHDALSILQACCYLTPEVPISQRLLSQWANDEVASNQALTVLRTYSLVNYSIIGHVSIHQAVQDNIKLMITRNIIPSVTKEENLTTLAKRLTDFFHSDKHGKSRMKTKNKLEPHLATVKQYIITEQQQGGTLLYFHHQYQIVSCQVNNAIMQHDAHALLSLSEELLEINWVQNGINPSKLIFVLLNLATAYLHLRKIDHAKIIYQQAKDNIKHLTEEDGFYRIMLMCLSAEICQREGKLSKAEKKCKSALALLQTTNTHGNELEFKVEIHHTLANIYSAMGDSERQKIQNELAYRYSQQSPLAQDCDSISITLNRANYHLAVGEYDKALTMFNQLKTAFITRFSEDNQEIELIYYGIAQCQLFLGSYSEALHYAKKSLDIAIRSNEEQSKNIIEDYILLGKIYTKMGDYQRAEEHLNQPLTIIKQSYGSNHPKMIQPLGHLNNLYLDTKDRTAHKSIIEQLKTLCETCSIPDHPELIYLHINLAGICQLTADDETAISHCQQALAIAKKAYPDGHNRYVEIYIQLSKIYLDQGELDDAKTYSQQAIDSVIGTSVESTIQLAEALNALGDVLINTADFRTAIDQYKKALVLQEKIYHSEHPELIKTLTNLGAALETKGDDQNALEAYIRAKNIAEHHYQQYQFESIRALIPLARFYKKKDQLREAQTCYAKACDIIVYEFDATNLNLVSLLTESASVHQELAAYYLAEQNLLHAMSIAQQHSSSNPITLAEVFITLARLHLEKGSYPSALDYAQKARTIQQDKHHKNHPKLAQTLILLGEICGADNNFTAQRSHYDSALAILQTIHKNAHPDIADLYTKYATLYSNQFDIAEQIRFQTKALDTLIECHGEDSPMITTTMCELCEIFLNANQLDEADELLQRSKKIIFAPSDARLALINMHLGVLASRRNDLDSLLKYYQESISLEQEAFGVDHLQLACTHSICGNELLRLGQHKKALQCYQHALTIRKKQLGPDNPKVARTLAYLGKANRLINLRKSLNYYQSAVQIYQQCYGENHHLTIETESLVGHALLRCSQPEAALALFQAAYHRGQHIFTDNHHHLLSIKRGIGLANSLLERYEQAQNEFEQVLAICTITDGSCSELTQLIQIRVLNNLGHTCYTLGQNDDARKYFHQALTFRNSANTSLKEPLINSLTMLGVTYLKENTDKAKKYLYQAAVLDKSWHRSKTIQSILILQGLILTCDLDKDATQLKTLLTNASKRFLQLYPHLSQPPHNTFIEAIQLFLRTNNLLHAKHYCELVFRCIDQNIAELEHLCATTLFVMAEEHLRINEETAGEHLQINEETNALTCLKRSYEIQMRIPFDYSLLLRTLGSLTQLTYALDNDQLMQHYFKRAKVILKNKDELLNDASLSPSLLMIGRIAIVLEETLFGRKVLYKALQGLLQSPKEVIELDNKIIFCSGLLANIAVECEEKQEAKKLLTSGIEYSRNHINHNEFEHAMLFIHLIQNHLDQDEVDDANQHYSTMITYLDSNEIDSNLLIYLLLTLAEQFATKHQFNHVIPYLKQALNLQDSTDMGVEIKMDTLTKLIAFLTISERYEESIPYRTMHSALLQQSTEAISPLLLLQAKMQQIGGLIASSQHNKAYVNACEALALGSTVYPENDPQLVMVYLTCASTCLAVDKNEDAKKLIQKCITILDIVGINQHRVLTLLFHLSKLLLQRERFADALIFIQQLLQCNPEELNNLELLTSLYTEIIDNHMQLDQEQLAQEKLLEAHSTLQPLIDTSNIHHRLLFCLISTKLQLDDVQQAYHYLIQYYQLIANNHQVSNLPTLHSFLISDYLRLNTVAEALTTVQQACSMSLTDESSTQSAALCIAIANYYHHVDDEGQSLFYLKKAYSIADHFPINSEERSRIRSLILTTAYLPRAQFKECINHVQTDLRLAVESSSSNPAVTATLHITMAEWCIKIGKLVEAQSHIQSACLTDDLPPEIQLQIKFVKSLLCTQQGQSMAAVQYFHELQDDEYTEISEMMLMLSFSENIKIDLYEFSNVFNVKVCLEQIMIDLNEISVNPVLTYLHSDTLLYLGDTLLAHLELKSHLPQIRSQFGLCHPLYADGLLIMAQIEHQLGHDESALEYCLSALKIHADYYGENNYLTFKTRYQYAALLYQLGRHKDARQQFATCQPILSAHYSSTNWYCVSIDSYLQLLNGDSISQEQIIQQHYLENSAMQLNDAIVIAIAQKCCEQYETLTSSDIISLIAELNHAGLFCYVAQLTPYLFIAPGLNTEILMNFTNACVLTNQLHLARNVFILAREHGISPEVISTLENSIAQASENKTKQRHLAQEGLDIDNSPLIIIQQSIIQLIEQGQYNQAIENLKKHIKNEKNIGFKSNMLSVLAQCYMMKGELNNAQQCMQDCISIQPDAQHFAFIHNIARVNLVLPKLLQAIKAIHGQFKHNYNTVQVLTNRGMFSPQNQQAKTPSQKNSSSTKTNDGP